MLPPAPVRFSTTTGWPSRPASWSDTVRAMMSMALPAVTGTITCSGLLGQLCACDAVELSTETARAARTRHHMDRLPGSRAFVHTGPRIAQRPNVEGQHACLVQTRSSSHAVGCEHGRR